MGFWRWRSSPANPPELPELGELRILYVAGYWRGPNDMARHMLLGLRSLGLYVHDVNTDERPELLDTEGRHYDRGTTGPVWLRYERLAEDVARARPNLVICNSGGLGLRRRDAERLHRQGAFLLGFAYSDPDVFEPATRYVAPQFDVFLTASPDCVPRYEALGVPSATAPSATNAEFFHPVPARAEMRCDVLVLGRAHADRLEPVRALAQRFDTHVYGEGWDEHGIPSRGLIYGDDVLAALNSARMSTIFFRTMGGHRLVKVGLFDFTAAGALVVTNRCDDVAQLFRFDQEIVGFASTDDLLEQVAHYLAHPEQAERIRLAGRERVLRDYTWQATWPRIFDTVRESHRRARQVQAAARL